MSYQVSLSHHSISRSPTYKAATLDEAKDIAEREFGDGFNDHEVVIAEDDEYGEIVARRRLDETEWR